MCHNGGTIHNCAKNAAVKHSFSLYAAKQHGMGPLSYERSQSLPTGSLGSAGEIFSPSSPPKMHALDTILEGSVAEITEEEPMAVKKEGENGSER